MAAPWIRPLGDAAVLVTTGAGVGPGESARVRAVAETIAAATASEPGWGAPVPGACSVLVPVDAVEPGAAAAARRLEGLLAGGSWASAEAADADDEVLEVPTRYGGEDGPDLAAVAEMLGVPPASVVERHAGTTYTTLFLGFAPGFGYLGPLPPELSLPRRPVPRAHVARGSVAIAGAQTAIYPIDSPGGWWLIGRTDLEVWDPLREPAALLRPGVRVRFVPEREP